jgi:hypothetical protein
VRQPKLAVLFAFATLLAGLVANGGSAVAATPSPTPTPAAVNVLTFHNDAMRSGLNKLETVLRPSNVVQASFGKLFSFPVDGYLYAEPLYVSELTIPGQGLHNVVYTASEHDSVYAFDADGLAPTTLWQKSFIDPAAGITTVSPTDVNCNNLVPEIGITGTPVISLQNQALYVVSETKNQNDETYTTLLHALDLSTGAEKFGGPVAISATVPGTGAGSDGTGHIAFDPLLGLQRAALLLANGNVYIAFASNCDQGNYHGWVFAYDALTLTRKAVFISTPNGSEGGIWQSGNGPSAPPSGNVFVGIGNGTFNGTTDFGDSYVKLAPNTLKVIDYFTPSNQSTLAALDEDGGITGAVLLPTQTFGSDRWEMVGGIKTGRLYLLRRGAMGGYCQPCNDSQAVGVLATHASLFDAPAFAFGTLYVGGVGVRLRAWQVINGLLATTPIARTATVFGYPGTSPAISSDHSLHRIVWALDNSGYAASDPAVLHAYTAYTLGEIYNSAQAGSRDTAGPAVKFTVPTVANGKVYVGTQTELDVYGLLPP